MSVIVVDERGMPVRSAAALSSAPASAVPRPPSNLVSIDATGLGWIVAGTRMTDDRAPTSRAHQVVDSRPTDPKTGTFVSAGEVDERERV